MPYADIYSSKAKDSLRAARRRWYANNRERAIATVVERKDGLKRWLVAHKSTLKCERCGESDPVCLDFHHEDPSKKDRLLSQVVSRGWSIKRIEQEIAKCRIFCSNCHRKHHHVSVA